MEQPEQIAVLEAEIVKRDKEIKDLKAKCLKTEIDALMQYKEYDSKMACLHTDLAVLRAYAAATKIEQHKALVGDTAKV